jgi:hypothetical protein
MADTKKKYAPTVMLRLPLGTARFPHVRVIDSGHKFSSNKFDCEIVLPGDTDFSTHEAKAKEMAKAAAQCEGWDDYKEEDLILPWRFRDTDDSDENLRGKYTVKPKSKKAPVVYDAKRNEILAKYSTEGKPDPKTDVWGGDSVKLIVQASLFRKVDTVTDKKTRKTIQEVSFLVVLHLVAVQIVEKKSSGGGGDWSAMLDDEDGYVASQGDDDTGSYDTSTVDDGADF